MNKLRELRTEKNLLQSDIAKIINKSERTVGFYETGERDMGTETLAILSDYFDVSIDYLLGKSDIRNPEELRNNKCENNNNRLDTSGLDEEDLEDIQKQIDYMRWKKQQEDKEKNQESKNA